MRLPRYQNLPTHIVQIHKCEAMWSGSVWVCTTALLYPLRQTDSMFITIHLSFWPTDSMFTKIHVLFWPTDSMFTKIHVSFWQTDSMFTKIHLSFWQTDSMFSKIHLSFWQTDSMFSKIHLSFYVSWKHKPMLFALSASSTKLRLVTETQTQLSRVFLSGF